MKKQTRRNRHAPYSDKFLADYGRNLTRDDIRLVQAFRGLSATKRAALLEDASLAVIRQAQEAPAGLRAMFSMLVLDGYKPISATNACHAAYPHAVRIVDAALTTGDEGIVVKEVEASTLSLFPNLEEPIAPSTAQEAAFNVGFAVCWLLMMAVSGRDGAR